MTGLGGAGFPGDPASSGASHEGLAGSGTMVAATFNLPAASVRAGDTLQITVGAKGSGGQRGYGSELSGSGGNGGGATYVYDLSDLAYLLVAGGGGGGGGGAGASRTASGAIDVSRGPSNNTGDGYVVVTLSTTS